MGTGIEATSTNAEPIQLGMGETGRGVESLLDSTSTYCRELLGVDQMWVHQGMYWKVLCASDMDSVAHAYVVAPARTHLHVSFARVIPCCPCVFRCRPMARLPLATLAHRVLLSHQPIIVKLSVVTL